MGTIYIGKAFACGNEFCVNYRFFPLLPPLLPRLPMLLPGKFIVVEFWLAMIIYICTQTYTYIECVSEASVGAFQGPHPVDKLPGEN